MMSEPPGTSTVAAIGAVGAPVRTTGGGAARTAVAVRTRQAVSNRALVISGSLSLPEELAGRIAASASG
jgi:hypothetical protein